MSDQILRDERTDMRQRRAMRATFRLLRNLAENGIECCDADARQPMVLRSAKTAAEEAVKVAVALVNAIDQASEARAILKVVPDRRRP